MGFLIEGVDPSLLQLARVALIRGNLVIIVDPSKWVFFCLFFGFWVVAAVAYS